jgi:hypothetical protein
MGMANLHKFFKNILKVLLKIINEKSRGILAVVITKGKVPHFSSA